MDTHARRTRDEWLALRCRLGEPGAFAELVREMERPLLYYAAKLLADEDAAFDVLQEVWLAAFRGVRRLNDPRTVRPWLYRITRGRAIDRVRRDRSRGRAERARAESTPEGAGGEPSFGVEDARAVHRALDRIDLRHREVLVLHFLDDLSVADIAAVIGEPAGTVKSRIHYAKRALKGALHSHDPPR
jgi:RNA polymerase sigma-70 factor (ECF subfamily)